MLSFLYRLIRSFRGEHGFSPNTLYVNENQYDALRENLPQMAHEETENFLQLRIALVPGALHPHVAWQDPPRKRATGGG
jgi:hypothetical protein